MLALYFLVAAVTIRADTTLRAGCEADAEVVTALPAGQPVEVKFALAGGGAARSRAGAVIRPRATLGSYALC